MLALRVGCVLCDCSAAASANYFATDFPFHKQSSQHRLDVVTASSTLLHTNCLALLSTALPLAKFTSYNCSTYLPAVRPGRVHRCKRLHSVWRRAAQRSMDVDAASGVRELDSWQPSAVDKAPTSHLQPVDVESVQSHGHDGAAHADNQRGKPPVPPLGPFSGPGTAPLDAGRIQFRGGIPSSSLRQNFQSNYDTTSVFGTARLSAQPTATNRSMRRSSRTNRQQSSRRGVDGSSTTARTAQGGTNRSRRRGDGLCSAASRHMAGSQVRERRAMHSVGATTRSH